jgi:hypothetical protein
MGYSLLLWDYQKRKAIIQRNGKIYGGRTDEIIFLNRQYESGKAGIPEERPVTRVLDS